MAMQETYDIIADEAELDKFLEWLPEQISDECIYVAILARGKYARELGIGSFNSDRHQCARFLTSKDRLKNKLKRCEAPIGSYYAKGVQVPQSIIAAYCTLNPRSYNKGKIDMINKLVKSYQCQDGVPISEMGISVTHQAVSRRLFVDFDFDNTDMRHAAAEIAKVINADAVTIIQTRGGFHAIVKTDKVKKEYVKSWHASISAMPGVDVIGDTLLPIPGTYQGGFIPRMFQLSELL